MQGRAGTTDTDSRTRSKQWNNVSMNSNVAIKSPRSRRGGLSNAFANKSLNDQEEDTFQMDEELESNRLMTKDHSNQSKRYFYSNKLFFLHFYPCSIEYEQCWLPLQP